MKKILSMLLVIALCFCISACGRLDDIISQNGSNRGNDSSNAYEEVPTYRNPENNLNSPPDVAKIETDIINWGFLDDDTVIDSVTIIKRQTTIEQKKDIIYLTLHMHTEECKIAESYVLYYNLYNEGWILDNVDRYWDGENYISASQGPSQHFVESIFTEYNSNASISYYYNQIIDQSFDANTQTAWVKVQAGRMASLWETEETLEFNCYFDGEWHIYDTVDDSRVEMFVDRRKAYGTYRATEEYIGVNNYELTIFEINEIAQIVRLECTIHFGWDGDEKYWSGYYPFSYMDPTNEASTIICDLDGWSLKISADSIYMKSPGGPSGAYLYQAN